MCFTSQNTIFENTLFDQPAFTVYFQKHSRLISVIEALDNGKPIRETRDCDIPLVARHFYHHAGWAQLMDDEMAQWKPVGVIGRVGKCRLHFYTTLTPRQQTEITSGAAGCCKFAATLRGPTICLKRTFIVCLGHNYSVNMTFPNLN